jgi:hypothetical protein
MRSVIKVDLVARVEAQSNGAPEPLDPAAGIHGETGVPGLDSAQSSHEVRTCVLIGNAEVHKADLPRHIDPEWSRLVWNLGPNKPVSGRSLVVTNCVEIPLEKTLVKLRSKS